MAIRIEVVYQVRALLRRRKSHRQIAKLLGNVSRQSIDNIANGITQGRREPLRRQGGYKHIKEQVPRYFCPGCRNKVIFKPCVICIARRNRTERWFLSTVNNRDNHERLAG